MSAQAVVAAALTVLVAVDAAGPAMIALLTLLSGCAAAIGFPAYQASFRHLVPPEDLPAAIGLSSAQWNLGRILGPVAAAVAIGVGGISWALAINTLSFLAVIVAVASVRLPSNRCSARPPSRSGAPSSAGGATSGPKRGSARRSRSCASTPSWPRRSSR